MDAHTPSYGSQSLRLWGSPLPILESMVTKHWKVFYSKCPMLVQDFKLTIIICSPAQDFVIRIKSTSVKATDYNLKIHSLWHIALARIVESPADCLSIYIECAIVILANTELCKLPLRGYCLTIIPHRAIAYSPASNLTTVLADRGSSCKYSGDFACLLMGYL